MKKYLGNFRNFLEDALLTRPFFILDSSYYDFKVKSPGDYNLLKKNGFLVLNNFIKKNELKTIQNDFNNYISENKNIYIAKNKYIRLLSPFMISESFIKIAANNELLSIIKSYFCKQCYVADVDARRIFPDMQDMIPFESSASWHKDCRGRQLKLMIYLTDVGEKDNYFSAIPGTHINNFWRAGYKRTRYLDSVIDNKYHDFFKWFGKAGDACIFDTNIIHRLVRNKGANIRDSFTIYYTPGQELRELNLGMQKTKFTGNPIFDVPNKFLFRKRFAESIENEEY